MDAILAMVPLIIIIATVANLSATQTTQIIYGELEDALSKLGMAWKNVELPSFFRMGSWIGADRDGNPFVDAKALRLALRCQNEKITELPGTPVGRMNTMSLGMSIINCWFFMTSRNSSLIELGQLLWGLVLIPMSYSVLRKFGVDQTWSMKFSFFMFYIGHYYVF